MSEAQVISELKEALKESKETIGKQGEVIERLTMPPLSFATVLSVKGGYVSISSDKGFLQVPKHPKKRVRMGETVVVNSFMQIVDKASFGDVGETAYLLRVLDEELAEVEYQSSSKIVYRGTLKEELSKGDKVVLDRSASVILRNLGKDTVAFKLSTSFTGIEWDDIGGLDEAKQQLIEAVELPYKHPEIFKHYGKKPPKGILLYGAPGCGKTMLGKAVATSISKTFTNGGSSDGFIYVKSPEILNKYVGVSEATIQRLFQQALKFKEENGYPAVLFIDEADAILGKRGTGISSDVNKTIVPMFLAEMDGLENSGALVILVTNRPDTLDSAVIREGRIDIKIKVGRPTPEAIYEIFLISLKGKPLGNGYSCEELSCLARDELLSPKHILYQVETRSNGSLPMTMRHIVSGSMVVNIIDKATSLALNRDLASNSKGGIQKEDVMESIAGVIRQSTDIEHADEIAEFVEDTRSDVIAVRKGR